MNKKDALDALRKAAASNPELQQALAELEKEPDGDELEKAQAARVKAEKDATQARKDADAVRYEALIAAAKADAGNDHARKIRGPAHEKRVRDQYGTLAELERYLATAEPGPELRPHQADASGATAAASEVRYHDAQFLKALQTAGVDTKSYAQHKAATAAPTVRNR